ncbi:hypothetical protein L1F30_07570 [Simiduia sp. 21SJ11W-1]|uniref:hypothetical protein n=1 Tax=Simiduia sp. 21SJ11W-1 TaxID=2909669 RepID=UPI00209DFADB|nr:hypothetical protein [Simiduia sp. 21SJ11W-1]UTA49385.1 hypothetical protein L1F30_07570 [Simiduia sp. 21SJ11W-1]
MAIALQNNNSARAALAAQEPKTCTPTSRITELVIPKGDQQSMLLPMICFLGNNNQRQWLTLISVRSSQQHTLKSQGVNAQTLRVIQASSHNDVLWMTWEALSNGTSHTVVAELPPQPKDVLKELERAAHEGNSRLILVSQRGHEFGNFGG